MNYKIGFDGAVTSELQALLLAVEKQVNGFFLRAQTSEAGGASVASGTTSPVCPPGQDCSNSVKGGHDLVVVVVVAAVTGAVAGYVAGKLSVKGGHDGKGG